MSLKKNVVLLCMCCLMLSLFAQVTPISDKTAHITYLKFSNTEITEDMYLAYARLFESATYNKYIKDEFEWNDQFAKIKNSFNQKIAETDLEATYSVTTGVDVGEYDFTNGGYTVQIKEGTFFPFAAGYHDFFRKAVALSLVDFYKFNFFEMEKEAAKAFLQGRRNSFSNSIDRSVTLLIYFTLAPSDSAEYKSFANLAGDTYYPLVANITKIEVYDAKNSRDIKLLGELIIK